MVWSTIALTGILLAAAMPVASAAQSPAPPARKAVISHTLSAPKVTRAAVAAAREAEAGWKAHTPTGSAHGYALTGPQSNGEHLHWPKCEPIHWALDITHAQALNQEVSDVEELWSEAFEEIGAATGYTFVHEPSAAGIARPQADGSVTVSGTDAHLLVTFVSSRPSEDGYFDTRLKGTTAGLAGFTHGLVYPSGGPAIATDAVVRIDEDEWARFPLALRKQLLRHELAHAFGLAHVEDADQVLQSSANGMHPYYEAGDLAGLRFLADLPCAPGK